MGQASLQTITRNCSTARSKFSESCNNDSYRSQRSLKSYTIH